jgi:hypothetical protein
MPTSEELKHTHTHTHTQTTKSLVNWMADLNAECSTASYHPNDESDVFLIETIARQELTTRTD